MSAVMTETAAVPEGLELEPGERVIWVGRPRPDVAARSARVLVPIGVMFLGTAIVFFWIAWTIVRPWVSPASLPFALIGLALIASPRWYRRRAERTVYILTDRRAIVRRPDLLGREIKQLAFAPPDLDGVVAVADAEGAGNLDFYIREETLGEGVATARRGFEALDQVAEIEGLVRRTLLNRNGSIPREG
jgi:hypothetical protein